MLRKSMKWIATLVAFLMAFSFVALFAGCGETNEEDESWRDDIEYQIVTYCIGHSEWGLLTLYTDGTVLGYGRMVQDLTNYGMEGYQITRTRIDGNWKEETDRDDITMLTINFTHLTDVDGAGDREYDNSIAAIQDEDGTFSFESVTIPMYMPEYGMTYDTCTTDFEWTYFLEKEDFVKPDVDTMDAYFIEMDEKRSSDSSSSGSNVEKGNVLATFVSASYSGEGSVYAYLYDSGYAEINNDYFASTGTWSYDENGLVITYDSTDFTSGQTTQATITVTIEDKKASFSYESYGMSYSFSCSDISALIEYATSEGEEDADEETSSVAMLLPVATFEATSSSSTLYAYLYNDYTAEINNDYFASTGTWSWNGTDTTFTIANDNETDTYTVTVSGQSASFSYSYQSMLNYTFSCSDISMLTAFAKGDPVATFTGTSSSVSVNAYLYYDCTVKIETYISGVTSTGTWSWNGTDTTFTITNDNGTDTYTVTVSNGSASFEFSSTWAGQATFTCSDISAFIAFASQTAAA